MSKTLPAFAPGSVGSPENPARVDVNGGDFFRGAHELYAELRRQGPVARARFHVPERAANAPEERDPRFVEEFWLVTDYDDAVAVLQDDVRFTMDPTAGLSDEERARLPTGDDALFMRSLLATD